MSCNIVRTIGDETSTFPIIKGSRVFTEAYLFALAIDDLMRHIQLRYCRQ